MIKPNRFDVFVLTAAAVVTLPIAGELLFTMFEPGRGWSVYEIYLKHLSVTAILLFGFGWIIFTYGTLCLAAVCWRWTKQPRQHGWIYHLLLVPCCFLTLMIGNWMMVTATGVSDWDDTIGAPIMTGAFLFMLGIVGYYAAVIARLMGRRRAN